MPKKHAAETKAVDPISCTPDEALAEMQRMLKSKKTIPAAHAFLKSYLSVVDHSKKMGSARLCRLTDFLEYRDCPETDPMYARLNEMKNWVVQEYNKNISQSPDRPQQMGGSEWWAMFGTKAEKEIIADCIEEEKKLAEEKCKKR